VTAGFVLSFSVTALALSAITRIFDFDSNSLRTAATARRRGPVRADRPHYREAALRQ
jgi:hypothetical protein